MNKTKTKKLLLTSICRPLGPEHGDGIGVGYETMHGQITRAQGLFSPRTTQIHFSLDYIAENLEIPAVVLQYPSRREFIRELKKGYDFVGISFILATFHKMKEMAGLVRKYSPASKIILGGYGTVLNDDTLKQYGDYFCRGEGISFMRQLLGEPPISAPYKHPLIENTLKVFSIPASTSGTIFAGLGCPNGCDFCCTSHFFKRKHIKLLPDGKDIYNVVERYLEKNPEIQFTIIDEDFLLNKERAMQFRDCVQAGGKPVSIFVFSSVRAISQYSVHEILDMGIDGFWIGYEGSASGYGKQGGRPVDELFLELKEHGINILASMIVGFDYQTPEVIAKELDGLMKLKPGFVQCMIYGGTPGTPFYDKIVSQGLLHNKYAEMDKYCLGATGFNSMVKHPAMSPSEIEKIQRWCFDQDFQRLGPSIYRSLDTWLMGYKNWKKSSNALLLKKAELLGAQLRKSYPIFLAGRLFGPNRSVRRWIRDLERSIHSELGRPTSAQKLTAWAAVAAAGWTAITLRLKIFQHPRMIRSTFRM